MIDDSQGDIPMQAQPGLTAVELEIQSFTSILHRCFVGVTWEVVSSYAPRAWSASNRADASWSDVAARVRIAWEAAAVQQAPV